MINDWTVYPSVSFNMDTFLLSLGGSAQVLACNDHQGFSIGNFATKKGYGTAT